MLPFDLTKALAAPDSVVYRNGEVPLEWHYFEHANDAEQCVYSILSGGFVKSHSKDGSYYLDNVGSPYDLFLKEPEMFVMRNKSNNILSDIYFDSKLIPVLDGYEVLRLVEVIEK